MNCLLQRVDYTPHRFTVYCKGWIIPRIDLLFIAKGGLYPVSMNYFFTSRNSQTGKN